MLLIIAAVSFLTRRGKVAALEHRIRELELEKKPQESYRPQSEPDVLNETTLQQTQESSTQPTKPTSLDDSADFEHTLGGNIFTKIGIVTLLFGIAFLFNYAYQNEWIGPTGWVTLGIVVSTLLIGAGEFLATRYRNYGHTLVGGGVAILFLSLWAMGPAFYGLVGQMTAFLCLLVAVLGASALALRENALVLMIIALLGAFLTPFLAQGGFMDSLFLFGYLAFVNIGILLIAAQRHWKELILIGLFGTTIIFITWYESQYQISLMALTELFAIIFFIIFSLAPIAYSMMSRQKSDGGDLALTFVAPFLYYSFTYQLLQPIDYKYAGLSAFGVCVWYLLLLGIAYVNNKDDRPLLYALGSLVIAFLNIWIAVALDGSIITLLLLLQAAGCSYVAFQLKDAHSYYVRVASLTLLVFGIVRLLSIDSQVKNIASFMPIFNGAFFNFCVATLVLIFVGYLYRRNSVQLLPNETNLSFIAFLAANLLFFFSLNMQLGHFWVQKLYLNQQVYNATVKTVGIDSYSNRTYIATEDMQRYQKAAHAIKSKRNLSFSILWMLYATIGLITGIILRSKSTRLFALGLFGITIGKIFLYDAAALQGIYRILSFILLGILLIISGFLYQKYKERIADFIKTENS